jgi:hypothetical protein
MGNANIDTRDNSPLPTQATASLFEISVTETQDDYCETTQTDSIQTLQVTTQPLSAPAIQPAEVPLAAKVDGISTTTMQSAVFEMAVQPEDFFELDVIPPTAKREMVFTHEHFEHPRWDENLFAFLAGRANASAQEKGQMVR